MKACLTYFEYDQIWLNILMDGWLFVWSSQFDKKKKFATQKKKKKTPHILEIKKREKRN
jgi:hypothetical protein